MTTLKLAGLSAFAVLAFANVEAQAGSLYFPVSMCQATDDNGIPSSAVRFRLGVAENFHDTVNRYLRCPIPYDPDGGSPVIVRVVGFDNNNGSDGKLRAVICETLHNNTNVCPSSDQTTDAFIGPDTLEVQYFPGPNTRWLNLTLMVPDVDSQSGRSFYWGYRVCQGSC